MRSSDTTRIAAFDDRFAQAQATNVVDLSWGYAVLQDEFPLSEYHNRIAVTSAVPAAEVLATAEEVLGGAALRHRYISAPDALGQTLSADVGAAGYEHETTVTMIHSGPNPQPAAHEVRAVSLDTLRPALIRAWRATFPDMTDEHLGQLADRTALYERGADVARLAVYDGDEIAAHADLYLDRADRIAQFENLFTHDEFRNRGYADALLREALRRGSDAGRELSFLTAELNDWPHKWYERCGYVDAGRTHHFSRHAP